MLRSLLALCSLFLCALALPAQDELPADQFRAEFQRGLDTKDDTAMDRAIKRSPSAALLWFEELVLLQNAGDAAVAPKVAAVTASWTRAFESGDAPDRVLRWASGASAKQLEMMRDCRRDATKVWKVFQDDVEKNPTREGVLQIYESYQKLAEATVGFGHSLLAAEMWNLAAVVAGRMPKPTTEDRKRTLTATEEFLRLRKDWGFTGDTHYMRNSDYVKAEKTRLDDEAKKSEKRKAEGYSADAKGIDALVKAGVAEAKHELKFEPLANLDELDYGPRNGPVPAFWNLISLGKEGEQRKFDWFKRSDLYLARTGAAKFAISVHSNELKDLVEVDVSPKAKISPFWLDAAKKQPYAMAFWIGSDREMVNEAACNLTIAPEVANIYYRSAASWKTQVGADPVTLYDDDADGTPGDADPFSTPWKSEMLGVHDDKTDGEGTPVPLLDSMRVGKGPRMPFSEFVKLSTGWHYVQVKGESLNVRPLNPEYVKTGKLKLVWSGSKTAAPAQLVVRGAGDYQSAFFDLAGGKEVEVPAGEYHVLFGRIVVGKGPRVQMATLYRGDSESFLVEAGKVKELKMGGPFTLSWKRDGDDPAVIDALTLIVKDGLGCAYTQWHGLSLACDVLASSQPDGKGAKVVGKFVPFTDADLVNEAAKVHQQLMQQTACFPMPEGYKQGPLQLKVDLPAAGMKLQLVVKKHPWFGVVQSLWKGP